ncbi:MAG TPA: hypothetical protein VH158_09185 [Gemmatimonadales bacterium]|jgi:hypothetical protein|nr:hypothetical protein [Gemmatimonadales bacterium]
MQVARVQLTGWKAVAVLAALLVYGGIRYHSHRVSLETAGRDAVRSWLVAEYERSALADPGLPRQLDSATADELLRRSEVELGSLSARGWGDNVVVRVEIAVRGGPPPDGRSVRYLRLAHGFATGWRVIGSSSAFSYYTSFW